MENSNVAYCGLYCAECRKFKKEKCPGCYKNEKASWCKIRTCCLQNGFSSCADCTICSLDSCKKYNNVVAKIIGFMTQTKRNKCIDRIKKVGVEQFAKEMSEAKTMSMKR